MKADKSFSQYMTAFETLDPEQFVPFYNVPCIFITPMGVFSASDSQTAMAIGARLTAQAKTQGYARSEIVGGINYSTLSPDLATISGTMQRLNTAEDVIMTFGFTYMLRKVSEDWKIVVLATFAPQSS